MRNSRGNWNEWPVFSRESSKAAAVDEQVMTGADNSEKIEPDTAIKNNAPSQDKIYPSGWKFLLITLGIMAAVLVVALDNYIISTAIPRLATDFKSINLTGWYSSSYLLTTMAFQPAHGQIFTFFSVKWAFLISILCIEVGSIISAAAPNSIAFIFGRLICGAAAGGIWCGTLTLVTNVVPPAKRYLYVSVVTSMYGVSSAAGPLLGGLFTDSKLTWRFCFWLNLPIGFVAFLLIVFSLEPPEPSELGKSLTIKQKIMRIDFLGTLLLITAFTCFFLAAQWGGTTYAWSNSKVWGCILGFFLQIAAFSYLQVRLQDSATIPIRALRNFTALLCLLYQLFISMIIAIQICYLPFYFQSVLGHSAASSGVLTLPYVMTLLFSPMASGAYITAYGHYIPIMYLGACLAVVGSGLLSTLTITSSQAQYVGYQVIVALGAGTVQQITFTAVPLALPLADVATASALVSFCKSLGPVVALTVGNILFTNLFGSKLAEISGLNGKITGSEIEELVDLETLVPAQYVASVKQAFSFALSRTLVFAIPAAGLATRCGLVNQLLSWKEKKISSPTSGEMTRERLQQSDEKV
ncbi:hypothetical protein BOTNAR_0125g00050 [Botryotinia narcissicola]|uniref:Major facilitator superfamily (MFS) profile domain-containing protein n=1 Tax=Botryotinia narcissicola TaxID=278944 RepID=A0A4Z1IQT7_9HELO|nr:hypothetical protein BOTNAR_0125g00050 [Botryotinia narcissicola]